VIGHQTAQEGNAGWLGYALQPVCQQLDRVVPVDRLKLPGSTPTGLSQGVLDPIGVVEHLQAGLSSGA